VFGFAVARWIVAACGRTALVRADPQEIQQIQELMIFAGALTLMLLAVLAFA
jgi:hypothetical protein